jgi:hypothetical protein
MHVSLVTAAIVVAAAAPHGAKSHNGCNTQACTARVCQTVSCKTRVQSKKWIKLQRALPASTKAMLARLRGCETRGIPFPTNYRYDGHHDGAYQYDGPTWHEAGGWGYAYQASPAEQDVRTAWFYPSHRGRWECVA